MIPSWLWDRSTAHFRTALSTRFSSQSLNEENGSGTDPEVDDNEREFVCPMPDCFKAYKHSSGLRYHMKHVSTTMSTTRLLLTKCFTICSCRDTLRTCLRNYRKFPRLLLANFRRRQGGCAVKLVPRSYDNTVQRRHLQRFGLLRLWLWLWL